jgi:hypothetical protein
MKQIPVKECIWHTQLQDHSYIKNRILGEIEITPDPRFEEFGKSISKLDWSRSQSNNRPWVNVFKEKFLISIEEIYKSMYYEAVKIEDIWYQQYTKGDQHHWHIHGQHFTGVYYIEFPEGSPKTKVVSPLTKDIIEVDAVEGDLIIFPAHWIHSSGIPMGEGRKTIISFNFDMDEPTRDSIYASLPN